MCVLIMNMKIDLIEKGDFAKSCRSLRLDAGGNGSSRAVGFS